MYSRVEFEAFSRFEISNREAKLAVADRIAAAAGSGQTIGAGSGSTAFLAVHALSTRVKAGELEDIRLVPTSYEIETTIAGLGLASAGITYLAFEDLTIALGSGADTFTVDSTHAAGPAPSSEPASSLTSTNSTSDAWRPSIKG